MRPGIYRAADGRLARVTPTATGLLVRYADGEAVAVSA